MALLDVAHIEVAVVFEQLATRGVALAFVDESNLFGPWRSPASSVMRNLPAWTSGAAITEFLSNDAARVSPCGAPRRFSLLPP